MRTRALVLALPVGILLPGCLSTGTANNSGAGIPPTNLNVGAVPGAYGSAKLNNLKVGMTKEQVQSILGTPDSTSAQANVEYMIYDLDSDPDGRDRAYLIRLVDGRVESFGRLAELTDLYNRPVAGALPGPPNFPPSGPDRANPAGPPAAVAGAGTGADLATELHELKALKDQGALTDEEFRQAKAKLLSRL